MIRTPTKEEYDALDGCCLSYATGSSVYGLDVETSDLDLRGIIPPAVDDYINLDQPAETTRADSIDLQTWGLHHWLTLFRKGSPNALEIALLPEDAILHVDRIGRLIVDNARQSLNRRFVRPLEGYSHQQYKRWRKTGSAKNLMHSVRVMRMACELVEYGSTDLRRTVDRDELLAVRRGETTNGVRLWYEAKERLEWDETQPSPLSDGTDWTWMDEVKRLAFEQTVHGVSYTENSNT